MATNADFRQINKADARDATFPVQIDGEYRVYFDEKAYERMKKHTATTNEVELCGVLIGDVCKDSAGFFLKIDAVIEGENSNNYGAQVTFTHQTWEHINSVKDKQYPKQRIVGWYHTHPGFGVFLSGMDMFIQENTFNHPYQVAVVVETKQNVEGCFTWREGKSVPLTRYWVGKSEIKLATGAVEEFHIDKPGASAMPEKPRSAPPSEVPPAGLGTLFSMALLFMCGLLLGRFMEARNNPMPALQSEMYSLLEFAAMNTAATKDFAAVHEKLEAIRAKLKQNDAAGADADIVALTGELKTLESAYGKHQSDFRRELTELVAKKETLGERVETVARRQSDVDMAVGMLYLMRVGDLLTRNGALIDPATLTNAEKEQAKALIQNAITLAPDLKPIIEGKFPKLLPVLYPEQRPPESVPAGTK